MEARSLVRKVLRRGRDALVNRGSGTVISAVAEAMRSEVATTAENLEHEIEQLRAVVGLLQEQLDRWTDSTTEAVDALSERLSAVELAQTETGRR